MIYFKHSIAHSKLSAYRVSIYFGINEIYNYYKYCFNYIIIILCLKLFRFIVNCGFLENPTNGEVTIATGVILVFKVWAATHVCNPEYLLVPMTSQTRVCINASSVNWSQQDVMCVGTFVIM